MPNMAVLLILILSVLPFHTAYAGGDKHRDVKVQVFFEPAEKAARVEIEIKKSKWLKRLKFNLQDHVITDVAGNGKVDHHSDRLIWTPPQSNAKLSYKISIPHKRNKDAYDAYIQDNWALLRGEDLIPPVAATKSEGYVSKTSVTFHLPKHWTSVNIGWVRERDNTFVVQVPGRALDRPLGWIIAGDLGTRHEKMGSTHITVSAPKGHNFRQMEMMTFLQFVWPQFEEAFASLPEKILITGASDPMWRGGLSAPTSLYVHSDRPLISENGTSTLVHELVHVVTGIHGAPKQNWIAEGIAEFYAVELVYRAGGMSSERRNKIFSDLAAWGSDVTTLRAKNSSGSTTARAAVLFDRLDRELRQLSKDQYGLDNLIARLPQPGRVDVGDLKKVFKELTGQTSKVLQKDVLQALQMISTPSRVADALVSESNGASLSPCSQVGPV